MAKSAYNNAKHASTKYTPFKPNCGYHSCISYKEDVDLRSRSKAANELTKELRNLMAACIENHNMPKNCKNEPMIKELSLKVTLSVKKFS